MDRLAVASSVVSKINKRRVNPHGTSTKKAGEGATKHCNFMNKFREHQSGNTTTLQDATLSFIYKKFECYCDGPEKPEPWTRFQNLSTRVIYTEDEKPQQSPTSQTGDDDDDVDLACLLGYQVRCERTSECYHAGSSCFLQQNNTLGG